MKVLIIAAAFMALITDLVVSSIYYSYFDPGMNELRREFGETGTADMTCGEPTRRAGGQIIEEARCTGGILTRRDQYLRARHVIGPSWYDNNGEQDTRGIYFRYWF